MKNNWEILPSSFRDPNGFLYRYNGELCRQINKEYENDYDHLIDSGLYEDLIRRGLLIPHQEISPSDIFDERAYKHIKPETIGFISYPYEWCFSQLKDAALLTLKIQKIALKYGMSLKDASAYNVQFFKGKPVFIDTLSFECYTKGTPWIAYRQFCQHFFGPLVLMKYTDSRMNQLYKSNIDGIPLDLTSSLLPLKSWCNVPILLHIHLHAKSQKKYADTSVKIKSHDLNQNAIFGLVDNLYSSIDKIRWIPKESEWRNYYQDNSYNDASFEAKINIITHFFEEIKPISVWDFGSNTGVFSRLASDRDVPTVSFDNDPECVEINYRDVINKNERFILPLLLDIANPSPGIGWENKERFSLVDRGPVDTILALAIIHHLSIGNNLPFEKVAHFLSRLCKNLIIEFIPKNDPQVQKLLLNRSDLFNDYSKMDFEKTFLKFFNITAVKKVGNTQRDLYLMVLK